MYKSTADYNSGRALYDKYSEVDEEFLGLRKTVLARKTPRRMFVQVHTSLQGNLRAVLSSHPQVHRNSKQRNGDEHLLDSFN